MCSRKELSVLLAASADVDDEPLIEEPEPVCDTFDSPIVDISLSSVVGLTNPKTMKLRGKIQGEEVILLVDPGATNNFVSINTVQKFHLPYSSMLKFGVTLGNGDRIQGEGKCKQLRLRCKG